MPLTEPAPREHIHTRRIELNGFRREDGLWDIEARLVDTKGYGFSNRWRGEIAAGEPVHDMWLRLTVNDQLVIQAVEAVTDDSPFPSCPAVAPNFSRLCGLRIGPGWMKQVGERVGDVAGCTHLFELLRPLATAAMQTILPLRKSRSQPAPSKRPRLLDSCHGWRSDGEAVEELHPDWYTGS